MVIYAYKEWKFLRVLSIIIELCNGIKIIDSMIYYEYSSSKYYFLA